MANIFALQSVAESLATFLNNTYPQALRQDHPCTFATLSSEQINSDQEPSNTVSLYLHRVAMNEHHRNTRMQLDANRRVTPLSLDLHFLVSVWTGNAGSEQVILAWTMSQLHRHPVLDASSLTARGGWEPGEVIQLIPEDLSTEDIYRIWDSLRPSYRLSIAYTARVVQVVPAEIDTESAPVVAKRLVLEEMALPR